MGFDIWILIAVVSFMLGYWLGYRHGRDEGYRLGAVFAPIEIRRRTLEVGRCTVCGTHVWTAKDDGAAQGERCPEREERKADGS